MIAYVFVFEMTIKIIGLTPRGYIKSYLNCFDGFITIIGILDIGLLYIDF